MDDVESLQSMLLLTVVYTIHTGVQPSCTITVSQLFSPIAISPTLLYFYYAYVKRHSTTPRPALPPDVTPLQVCSTILGSHIMKRECQVLSPLPRAGLSSPRHRRPHFPTSPSHWCQVSVSRTRYSIQSRRHRARCSPFIVITILTLLTHHSSLFTEYNNDYSGPDDKMKSGPVTCSPAGRSWISAVSAAARRGRGWRGGGAGARSGASPPW